MTARAGMQLPWKPGSFTSSNLSPAYSLLHQKKKPKTKQTLSYAWPWYLFFLDNFSFCVCQVKGKCMCRICIDQKYGGCLFIIWEIKGWRNILIWGQQKKVTEKQHACSSAIQIKANARLHLGATELAGLRSSNTSLVTEARCRTGTDTSYKKGQHLHLAALLTGDPVAYT